jgi:hypothetical protein
MNKEFVPYEESLELKELGFDEPCFTWHWDDIGLYNGLEYGNHNKREHVVSAPTYSQAFRWFRDNHGFYNQIHKGYGWEGIIRNSVNGDIEWNDGTYNSPEEAELACLRKLIELVKK